MDIHNIIYDISLVGLVICTVIIFVFALIPVKVSVKGILGIFKTLIISLAVFSFFAEPNPSTDLYRHYLSVDNGVNSVNSTLLVWRLILWIVSLTHQHGILPAMTVLIWGFLIYKILSEYIENNKFSTQAVFLYFISLFSGCALFYIITGIRSTLVSAIIAYAYFFARNKNKLLYYALVVVASLIHTIGGLLFIIIEVYEGFIKKSNRTAILKVLVIFSAVIFFLNSDLTVKIIQYIPGSYGSLLVSKWLLYTQYTDRDTLENSFRFLYVGVFAVISSIKIIKYKKIDFFDWLVMITVCSVPMMIFFERLPYFIGIVSLKPINDILTNSKQSSRIIYHIVLFFICSLNIYFFVYTLFAHVNFNGHSYYILFRRTLDLIGL